MKPIVVLLSCCSAMAIALEVSPSLAQAEDDVLPTLTPDAVQPAPLPPAPTVSQPVQPAIEAIPRTDSEASFPQAESEASRPESDTAEDFGLFPGLPPTVKQPDTAPDSQPEIAADPEPDEPLDILTQGVEEELLGGMDIEGIRQMIGPLSQEALKGVLDRVPTLSRIMQRVGERYLDQLSDRLLDRSQRMRQRLDR